MKRRNQAAIEHNVKYMRWLTDKEAVVMYTVIRCHIQRIKFKFMINQNDINFTMICHRNFATKWHSVFEDKDLKLSKETITNKTVCGYGVANQKSFYFIKNDDREFLSIEDLVNAYNEKFKFEDENPDQEVIYKRIIKKRS